MTRRRSTKEDIAFCYFMIGLLLGIIIGLATTPQPARSDRLTIDCTAPLLNILNQDCLNPTLATASATDSLFCIFSIVPVPPTIAQSRRDSVWRRPGGAINLIYNLPRGTYSIIALTARRRSDGTMKYSPCDTLIYKTTETLDPFRVRFQ